MQVRGVSPNSLTNDILISGWCKPSHQAELERVLKKSYRAEANKLFKEMDEKGFIPCETTLNYINSLIAKPGKKVDALRLLDGL